MLKFNGIGAIVAWIYFKIEDLKTNIRDYFIKRKIRKQRKLHDSI